MSIDVHVAASESRSRKSKNKSRSSSGTFVAWVEAKMLWSLGDSDNTRPVWALFFVRSGEAGTFVANLQAGRKVETGERRSNTWEFLRSAGYEYAFQRYPEGIVVNVFLPELFMLTPGLLDSKFVRFVILPPTAWLDEATNEDELEAQVTHVRRTMAEARPVISDAWRPLKSDEDVEYPCKLAGIFLHRLNARTRAPLIGDARFAAQILVAALDQGIATMASGNKDSRSNSRWQGKHGYSEHNIDEAKFSAGVAVNTTHEELEKFLAEQVAIFDRTREAPRLPKMLKVAPVAALRRQRRTQ